MTESSALERLFDELVDLSPEERAQRVAAIRAVDAALAEELVGLLAFDDPNVRDGRGLTLRPSIGSPPRVVGSFEIERELGTGGMGVVYLARQSAPVRRPVALKVIRSALPSPELDRRFELERESLARMSHPGIPRLLDAGRSPDGELYFAMEYVDGVRIDEWCDRRSAGLRDRVRLFVLVCRAVQHAHEKGVIHRDIKPSNVLVCIEDGQPQPKLIDFGIARSREADSTEITAQGQWLGTPEYMSPEQLQRDSSAIGTRSDVYGLGLLLYELVTGDLPFDRELVRHGGPREVERQIVEQRFPKASTRVSDAIAKARSTTVATLRQEVLGDLDNVLQRALEKDPQRRYPSPLALSEDLDRFLADEPVTATPPSQVYLLRKFIRRHRGVVAGVSAFVLALIGGLLGTTIATIEARNQAGRATEAAREAERNWGEAVRVTLFLERMVTTPVDELDGKETTLREAVDSAARRIDLDLGEEPRVAAGVHHAVGRAYLALRDLDSARMHLERAVALNRPWASYSPARTALHRVCCQMLSEVERRDSDFERAMRWVDDGSAPPAWDDDEDLNLRRALDLARGRVLMGSGRLDEAESILTEVLSRDSDTELLREGLAIRSDLALIRGERGDRDGAERALREVLERRLALLGGGHQEIARSYLNHAASLRNLGRSDEAAEQYRRAADTARSIWGETSPELAQSLQGLGHLDRAPDRRMS
ncbi:MAG: protein kinase, partial [Planctomycetes bacterium]|nr:protein kinase [Planctomycetota bacterium]